MFPVVCSINYKTQTVAAVSFDFDLKCSFNLLACNYGMCVLLRSVACEIHCMNSVRGFKRMVCARMVIRPMQTDATSANNSQH